MHTLAGLLCRVQLSADSLAAGTHECMAALLPRVALHAARIQGRCLLCSGNPFDPNSPLKQSAVERFPPNMFFVLRVVQLLR